MKRIVTLLVVLVIAVMVVACAPKPAPAAPPAQPPAQPQEDPVEPPLPQEDPVEPPEPDDSVAPLGAETAKFDTAGETCGAVDDTNATGGIMGLPSSVCCSDALGYPAFLTDGKCIPLS